MIRSFLSICIATFILFAAGFGTSVAQQSSNSSQAASSTMPSTISYQGVLAKDGVAVPDGDYTITTTLYRDASGTNSLWSGTYVVHTANGVFNLLIGSGEYPLPAASKLDGPLFLGVKIGEGAELPLTQLSSALSAMNVSDSSITAKKMGTDYIGSISINGQRFSTRGGDVNIITGDGMLATVDQATNSIVLSANGGSSGLNGKGAEAEASSYINNSTSKQTSASFNIDGTGVIGGSSGTAQSGYSLTLNSGTGGAAYINGNVIVSGSSTLSVGGTSSFSGNAQMNDGLTVSNAPFFTGASAYLGNTTYIHAGTGSGTLLVYGSPASNGLYPIEQGQSNPYWNGNTGTLENTSIDGYAFGITDNLVGDVNGQYYANYVTGIQGISVTANAPSNGQVLAYNSSNGDIEWNTSPVGWSLTGNAGTTPGSDFIGTTDTQNLQFGLDNIQAGLIEGDIGTFGNGNVALGYETLLNNAGQGNTALGTASLQNNTIGSANTANGYYALNSNTQGYFNVGSGAFALYSNTTGSGNTAVGGNLTLYHNTTGSNNSVLGTEALEGNTSGSNNTVVGNFGMQSNATGSNNTTLGANADVSMDGLTDATAIGYGAIANDSYNIQLGDSNVTLVSTYGNIAASGTITSGHSIVIDGTAIPRTITGDTTTNITTTSGNILLSPAQYVGIGKTAPTQTLDVNGAINSDTGYTIGDSAAPYGRFLRSNGRFFVADSIREADIPPGSPYYLSKEDTTEVVKVLTINTDTLVVVRLVADSTIAPSMNNVTSLGDTGHRFHDLYLGSHSLFIGDSASQTTMETNVMGLTIRSVSDTDTAAVTISSTGQLSVPTAVLPSSDTMANLGDTNQRFNTLYLGPNSLVMGNTGAQTSVSTSPAGFSITAASDTDTATVTVSPDGSLSADAVVASTAVLPMTDTMANLGDSADRFNTLYLGPNSLVMGNTGAQTSVSTSPAGFSITAASDTDTATVTVSPDGSLSADAVVASTAVLPMTDTMANLGDSADRFNTLYLGPNSLVMGNTGAQTSVSTSPAGFSITAASDTDTATVTVSPDGSLSADAVVASTAVLPMTDTMANLGDSADRFNTLYLGPNSLVMGNTGAQTSVSTSPAGFSITAASDTDTATVTVSPDGSLSADAVVASTAVLPMQDTMANLGDSADRFNTLYLGPNSLVMGNTGAQTSVSTSPAGFSITASSDTDTATVTVSPTGILSTPSLVADDNVTASGPITSGDSIAAAGSITSGNSIIIDGTVTPRLITGDSSLDIATSIGNIVLAPAGRLQIQNLPSSTQTRIVVADASGNLSVNTVSSFGQDYTSSNGITRNDTDFELGGALTQTTDIPLSGNNLTFSGSGNVGIGTSSPTSTLEVIGNEYVSNGILVGGINGISAGGPVSTEYGFEIGGVGPAYLVLDAFGTNNIWVGSGAGVSNSGANNTGTGAFALTNNGTGANNTAVGFEALATNQTTSNNTAIGYQADVSADGLTNATAIGANAIVGASNTIQLGNSSVTAVNTNGSYNTSNNYKIGGSVVLSIAGTENIFAGVGSGASNTGIENTAFGTPALANNTSGQANAAFGASALLSNTTGGSNSAFGPSALRFNTTGSDNSAFGPSSLQTSTTGSSNSSFGSHALVTNTTGSSNTAIGYYADVASNNLTNATAIGANAIVGESNALILGNGANVGIGTSTPGTALDVVGTVTAQSPSHDAVDGNSSDNTGTYNGVFGEADSGRAGVFAYSNGPSDALNASVSNTSTGNAITANGNVNIHGTVNMNLHQINSVTDPTSAQDAATKNYVDTHSGGGNGNSIENQDTTVQASANFDISGNGTIGGSLTLGTPLAVTNGGTGTGTTFDTGSIPFASVSGVYSQDNTDLFWDATNNSLNIGPGGHGSYGALDVFQNGGDDVVFGGGNVTGSEMKLLSWGYSHISIHNVDGVLHFSNTSNESQTNVAGYDLMTIDGSGTATFPGLVNIESSLDMNATQINNVEDPTNPQDAATKNYVDTHSGGGNGNSIENQDTTVQTGANFNIGGDAYIGDSVGIGTTTPTEQLDVVGNIHASGTITSGNSIVIDGTTPARTITADTALDIVSSNGGNIELLPAAGGLVSIGGDPTDAELTVNHQSGFPSLIVNGSDVVGADYPMEIVSNSAGLEFGSTTYGRILRLQDINQGTFYDQGIDGNDSWFLDVGNGPEAIVLTSGGNVGIGTTTPGATLEIDGSLLASPVGGTIGNNGDFAIGYNPYSVGTVTIAIGDGVSSSGYASVAIGRQSNSTGYVTTALGYQTTATDNISTAMGGNSTAHGEFSFAMGYLNTTNADNSFALGTNATTNYTGSFVYGDNSGNSISDPIANSFTVLATGGYNFYDDASGNPAMVITSGNVGIGTTTPAQALDVAGNIHASGTITSGNSIVLDGSAPTAAHSIASDQSLNISTKNNNTEGDITLSPESGQVGINTLTPGASLEVHAPNENENVTQYFNDSYSTSTPVFESWAWDDGSEYFFGTEASTNLTFYTNGYLHRRMTITSGGNVGIGTDAPPELLTLENGNLLLGNNNNTPAQLQFADASDNYFTTFAAGDQTVYGANINYVLPIAQGASGTVLTNDGSGNLSWAPVGAGSYILNQDASPQASANFNIDGSGTLGGNLYLPNSSATTGVIYMGGVRWWHNYGTNNAFLGLNAGNFTLIGTNNVAFGPNTLQNTTTGSQNTALGGYSLVQPTSGSNNTGVGYNAVNLLQQGNDNTAVGNYAGYAIVNGIGNTFVGSTANASGDDSNATAIGYGATVGGNNSLALGSNAQADNSFSIAIGSYAEALGDYVFAGGYSAIAYGEYSVAIGGSGSVYTDAGATGSTAIGYEAETYGQYSVALGNGYTSSGAVYSLATGQSHAEAPYSTALGNSYADVGNSEGYNTAIGYSYVAGDYTTALGYSYATGNSNTNNLGYSTAMGNSRATGDYSTAMGKATANGDYSTALGVGTATNSGSFVYGDNSGFSITDSAANTFNVLATGGIYFYDNDPSSNVPGMTISDTASPTILGAGTVTAGYFIGDGSQLTNVPTGVLALPYYNEVSDTNLFHIDNSGVGNAIVGENTSGSGNGNGVVGYAASAAGSGVFALNSGSGPGLTVQSNTGNGIDVTTSPGGVSVAGIYVNVSGNTRAILATAGLYGDALDAYSSADQAIYAENDGSGDGLHAYATTTGIGVNAFSFDGTAISATAVDDGGSGDAIDATAEGTGYALNASGPVKVTGNLSMTGGTVFDNGTNGLDPSPGTGTFMMWMPALGAFRAGQVTQALDDGSYPWDVSQSPNVGTGSVAFGINTTATGNYSTVMGEGSTAYAEASTAFGFENIIGGGGFAATAMGNSSGAYGNSSVAMGFNNYSFADYTTTMGSNATANASGSFVYGDGSGNSVTDNDVSNSFNVLAIGGFSLYDDASGVPVLSLEDGSLALQKTSTGPATLDFEDASGNYVTSFVAGDQSGFGASINYVLPIAQGAASTVLTNDGSGNLSWTAGGFDLPFSQSANSVSTLFQVSNSGVGTAIEGDATSGWGVYGTSSSGGAGVIGVSSSGIGMSGQSTNGIGLQGFIDNGGSGTAIAAVNEGASGDAIDATVEGSGYALNATGNVKISGSLANTGDNYLYSDAEGTATGGFTWETNSVGFAASIGNIDAISDADGLGVEVADNTINTRILELQGGGQVRFMVTADGSIQTTGWSSDQLGNITSSGTVTAAYFSGDGSNLTNVPATLVLPYTPAGQANSGDLFQISNTGSGNAIEGDATSGAGVFGTTSSGGYGVYGQDNSSPGSVGVYGTSVNGVGVSGYTSGGSAGVSGYSDGAGPGVLAENDNTGPGLTASAQAGDAIDATASSTWTAVNAQSQDGWGIEASSNNNLAIIALSTNYNAFQAQTSAATGLAIFGYGYNGVQGESSGDGYGVLGITSGAGSGVQAQNTGNGPGLTAIAENGDAIDANSYGAGAGLNAASTGSGDAIYAYAANGTSVYAVNAGSGAGMISQTGDGDALDAQTSGGGSAVNASANGTGVGIIASSAVNDAIEASTSGSLHAIVANNTGTGTAIVAEAASGNAILAGASGSNPTIDAIANASGDAIDATSSGGYALNATGNIILNAPSQLQFQDISEQYVTTFAAGDQTVYGANINYVLPISQGAASTVLTNDGSGNLSWTAGGFALPYTPAPQFNTTDLFQIQNNDDADNSANAIEGDAVDGVGVVANSVENAGLAASSTNGPAITAVSDGGYGIEAGTSGSGIAVNAANEDAGGDGYGLWAQTDGSGAAVVAQASGTGDAIDAYAANGYALNATGFVQIAGTSYTFSSTNGEVSRVENIGNGIGLNVFTGSGNGIQVATGAGDALYATSGASDQAVYFENNGSGSGLYAKADGTGAGITTTSTGGGDGIDAHATNDATGVNSTIDDNGTSNSIAIQATNQGLGSAISANSQNGDALDAISGSGYYTIYAENNNPGSPQGVISAYADYSGDAIDADVAAGSGIGLLISNQGTGDVIQAEADGIGNAITATGNVAINVGSQGGSLTVADSVTAAYYFGDGSHLTNIPPVSFPFSDTITSGSTLFALTNTGNGDAIDATTSSLGNAINATGNGAGYAINATANGSGGGLNVISNTGDGIDDSTSGNGVALYAVSSGNGYAIDASGTNGAGIIATTSGYGDALDASASGGGVAISASTSSGADAMDVTSTGGNDETMMITNAGATGDALLVQNNVNGADAIDAFATGSGGAALYARGVINQDGENVDVSAGNVTLDGTTNVYELTTGSSTSVTLPQANNISQVIYVYNSTGNSQTVGGNSIATGHGASFVYFPTSGWKMTSSF